MMFERNDKMTFEEAYTRLSEISAEMDKSDLPLETAVNLYSEAVKLVDSCKKEIKDAKLKIEKINNSGN